MPSDPRLLTLPALVALAAQQARDIWTANVRHFHAAGWDIVESPEDAGDGFALTVAGQLDLLSDLSRRSSESAVLALIADSVCYPRHCGLTLGRTGANGWALYNGLNPGIQFVGNMRGWPKHPPPVVVPALVGVTAPAEALALIALAVLGAPRE